MEHLTTKGSDFTTNLQLNFGPEKDHCIALSMNVYGEILDSHIPLKELNAEALKMTFGSKYKKIIKGLEQKSSGLKYLAPILAFNHDIQEEQLPAWLMPVFEELKALRSELPVSLQELAEKHPIQSEWVREVAQHNLLSTNIFDYQKIIKCIIDLWSTDLADFFDAVHWLGKNKITLAFGPMVDRMDFKETFIYRNTCLALGKMGGDEVLQLMVDLTKGSDKTAIQVACNVLGDLKDRKAVVPILDLLMDNDVDVKQVAISALGKINDPSALVALEHVEENDKSKFVRAYAREVADEIKKANSQES